MSKELVTKFAQHLESAGKSKSTITAYTKDLEQLMEHSDAELANLTADQVKVAIADLQSKHSFSAKTVSRKINSFRTFFNFLIENEIIKQNPAQKIEHPKITTTPPRVLSPMEYLALREVSRDNNRLYTMIELMLQTGLRIGEVSRLKLKHVNFDSEGHIHVEGYSTIGERKIPLNAKAKKIIEDYLEKLDTNDAEHPLFATRDGNPIIIRNIRSSIDRAMLKAGIEDACVNDLRNTFIVHQLKFGVPVDVVAETVGHKSKSTTQKYLEVLKSAYTPNGESKLIEV